MEIVFKTAVGVFIGTLAAAFTFTEVQLFRVELATKRAISKMATDIEQTNDRQAKSQQAEALRQAKIKADEWQRMEAARQLGARVAADELVSKQTEAAAWSRFYQPSEACKATWTGNCADDFIIAKRAFAERYKTSR